MQKSESIAALAASLAEAQGEIENATKNSQNPHLKNRYADLAEILNTVRPVLSRHGLAVSQHPSYSDGMVHVETIMLHKSGEWMSSTISTPVQKPDPQGVGSACTYARRYSLAAIVGLSQEDDDGHAASKPKPGTAPQQKPAQQPATQPPTQKPLITESQRKHLMAIYGGAPRADRLADANEILRKASPSWKDVQSFSELTASAADYLIKQLEAMRQGAA